MSIEGNEILNTFHRTVFQFNNNNTLEVLGLLRNCSQDFIQFSISPKSLNREMDNIVKHCTSFQLIWSIKSKPKYLFKGCILESKPKWVNKIHPQFLQSQWKRIPEIQKIALPTLAERSCSLLHVVTWIAYCCRLCGTLSCNEIDYTT